jgi:hypothetical protein
MMSSIQNWRDPIFAYFDYRSTNAATEGANSLIRTVDPCYARFLLDGRTEESDRWQQAGLLSGIARECFAQARRRLAEPAPQQR